MNICFIKGKIITKPEYKFIFIRNADAVIMFEIELENKSKIKVIGYNEIADKFYKELEKEDIIWIEEGISEYTNKMNVYDFAGNEWEWTLEKTSNVDNPCAYRGGNYNNSSTNLPVSGRGGNNTTCGYSSFIGFRFTFYIK